MKNNVKSIINDLVEVFYPNLCVACERQLMKGEEHLCVFCQNDLPETNFHLHKDNIIEKHFWGRVKIEHATAFYFFSKGSKVQHLLHQFKYKEKREIGQRLGILMGVQLKQSPFYEDIDLVVPIPLHKEKEFKRGYNQSAVFGAGLAEGLGIFYSDKYLERVKSTATQTKKTRIERWENVEEVFRVKNPEKLKGKHILLVDDVITTGATIEACAAELIKLPDVRVSVAALATAQHL